MEIVSIQPFWGVLIAVITALGSAGAWKFYEKKAELKRDEETFIKYDCRERISKMEILLERSASEKDEMRDKILELTREVAQLNAKVTYLEIENRRLLENMAKK